LVLVVVFGSGFITGYQKAVVQQLALTQNRGIELPVAGVEQADASAMVLAAQPPVIEEAGASIDVDNPDMVSPIAQTPLELVDVSLIADETTQTTTSNNIATLSLNTDATPKSHDQKVKAKSVTAENIASAKVLSNRTARPIKASSRKTVALKNVSMTIDGTANRSSEAVKASELSSEIIEVSKLAARYSIQVGMYGRRVNASNLVVMLDAQGLNAYISEYLNKKQQLRYNVRFGYFENKHTALKGLKHYSETMEGSGYLVRLKQTMHAENKRSSSSVPTDKTAQF
jgi:cell division septation protein DedD